MGARDDLTFDEATHAYRFLGEPVPGVTSILQPLQSFDGIPASVLAAKADLGRRVHLTTQLDDEDDLDESSVEDDVAPYLAGWRLFRRETGCVIELIEKRVYEPFLSYAGTLDRVLSFAGIRWLIDVKTSFMTPLMAGPQTAAYLRALGDTSVTHRGAVRLRPDGTYRFDHFTGADDWSAFMACLTLARFKESHA